VEEYPDLIAGRAQIADELRTGGLRELLARLRFDDYSVIDHHVQTLAGDEHAFVEDVGLDLAVDFVSAQSQLVRERADVGRLAHPTAAKVVVDLEERRDDRVDAFCFEELLSGHVPA